MAEAIGQDLRSVGVHQGLSPVLDVVRDYRWGRVEETLGEDPYLVGQLGAAYVRGLEGAGIIATLKHFAGYAASRAARNHAPVSIGPRELADVILPPFETALQEGGARSVMNSYTDVDGVPVGASVDLLRRLLRDQWRFDGTVVSDYWSIPFLATMHRVAEDDAAAGALAITAGIDVELPETASYGPHLVRQVRAGRVPESLVDESVRRVLRQKIDLGLLDGGPVVPADVTGIDLDSVRNRELASALAERSIVLLRNAEDDPASRRPDHRAARRHRPVRRRPALSARLLRLPEPRARPLPEPRHGPAHRDDPGTGRGRVPADEGALRAWRRRLRRRRLGHRRGGRNRGRRRARPARGR